MGINSPKTAPEINPQVYHLIMLIAAAALACTACVEEDELPELASINSVVCGEILHPDFQKIQKLRDEFKASAEAGVLGDKVPANNVAALAFLADKKWELESTENSQGSLGTDTNFVFSSTDNPNDELRCERMGDDTGTNSAYNCIFIPRESINCTYYFSDGRVEEIDSHGFDLQFFYNSFDGQNGEGGILNTTIKINAQDDEDGLASNSYRNGVTEIYSKDGEWNIYSTDEKGEQSVEVVPLNQGDIYHFTSVDEGSDQRVFSEACDKDLCGEETNAVVFAGVDEFLEELEVR